jgi:hypothetical protein
MIMRFLFMALLFALAAPSVAAQHIQVDVRKRTRLNGFQGERVSIHTPVLQPGTSVSIAPGIYQLQQDKMPCVVPDTKEVVAIPNVLSELKLAAVAPIPNPATRQGMENVEGLKTPGSK